MRMKINKSELEALIDNLCSGYYAPDTPGVCVGVIQGGNLIFCKGYGTANLEYGVPINGDTVFHCCSMAKQFTAACIALLIEQGKLSLNQSITDFLPLEGEPWSTLTVGNLVYMTDGLYDVYGVANFTCGIREDDYFTKEEFWDFIRAANWCSFNGGDKWNYSNSAYFLLGEIVQNISGQPLSEFADKNIFQPLGMKHTFLRDDRSKIIPNRAVGYSSYGQVHYNDNTPAYTTAGCKLSINAENMNVPGAGQLWSTVNDQLLWDRNFYNNRLGRGSNDLIRLITESGRLNNGAPTGYGMGHCVFDKNGYRHVSHGGWAGGYSCFIDRIMEQNVSVIILGNHTDIFDKINVYTDSNGIIDEIMKHLLRQANNGEPKNEINAHTDTNIGLPKDIKADIQIDIVSDIQFRTPSPELCGMYQDPETSVIWDIHISDGKISVEQKPSNYFQLICVDETHYVKEDGGSCTLVKSVDGSIMLHVQDNSGVHRYYPFIAGMQENELAEYEGQYYNSCLNITYEVISRDGELLVKNKNHHHTALDLAYKPTIRDTFITRNTNYISYYCITFYRDSNGRIHHLSYRDDEGSKRENLQFIRIRGIQDVLL